MSAPHVTGLVGLMRSANPLLTREEIKDDLKNTATPCPTNTPGNKTLCLGIPNAGAAVQAVLKGKDGVAFDAVINRLTPLFSFYSDGAIDHFYTVVPHMAAAALKKNLLPGSAAYSAIGTDISQFYSQFIPCKDESGCGDVKPMAQVSVFTTHNNPISGQGELVPLYRYSSACQTLSCGHVSHVYSTDQSESEYWIGKGYQLDGIEGYIYPRSQLQPKGAVKLCRLQKGDDYILVPGVKGPAGEGTDCTPINLGLSDYKDLEPDNTNFTSHRWIGWVYPVVRSQPICANAVECSPGALFDRKLAIPIASLGQSTSVTQANTPFTLTWNSSNATSCSMSKTLNGGEPFAVTVCNKPGTSVMDISGSCNLNPPNPGTHVFNLTCSDANGASSAVSTVIHTITPAPLPTASLSQSTSTTQVNTPFTLSWNSANATSCSMSKTLNGGDPFAVTVCNKPGTTVMDASGSCNLNPPNPGTHVFNLICFDANGASSNASTVIHTITPAPLPTASLSQSNVNTQVGTAFTLTWNSSNATSCSMSKTLNGGDPFAVTVCNKPGTSVMDTSGSCNLNPPNPGTHVFNLTCSDVNGASSAVSTVSHMIMQ